MMKINNIKESILNRRPSSLARYKAKRKTISIISSIARYVFLIAFSYILLYPLLFMLSHAFRDPLFYEDPTVEWVPKAFSFEQVRNAWEHMYMPSSLFNTLTVEVVSSLLTIVSCGVAAYGLACFDFKGKKVLNALLILLILVPTSMTLIPNYINYNSFDILGILGLIGKIIGKDINPNLLDTYWAVYLPAITAVGIKSGLCIFIYRQFYSALPKELHEAAWIDGAGPLMTYVRIVIPSSGVALLTVSLLSVIWHWNDFYVAQMFMTEHETMAMLISSYFNRSALGLDLVSVDSAMAACLMFILPVLIMYLLLQKKFIASISSTGIVG